MYNQLFESFEKLFFESSEKKCKKAPDVKF